MGRFACRSTMLEMLLAACILAYLSSPVSAQGFTVTGYADFEAWVEDIGSDDKEFYFDNHHFNLIMVGTITEDLFAAFEVEYEHAGEEIAMEYGYFGYTGFRDVRILAGKFIVPFGRFNKDLHPTTVNKVPDRPHGFRDILPQTYNDVGLWITGGKAIGNGDNRFVFDVFAVNGLAGDDGGGIRGLRDNDRDNTAFGRDDNKAVGGRLGIDAPYTGFDIGASVYTGKYSESAAGDDLRLTLFGVDASYQRSGFVLRGELVTADQDASAGDLSKTGGYLQASYLVGNGKVEPVVRYSARNMPAQGSDAERLSLGASFYVSPSSSVRIAYSFNGEKEGFESDNDTLVAQFNVIF
jgi:hypothetical protein